MSGCVIGVVVCVLVVVVVVVHHPAHWWFREDSLKECTIFECAMLVGSIPVWVVVACATIDLSLSVTLLVKLRT